MNSILNNAWEAIYQSGAQLNVAPYHQIVTLLCRHFPNPLAAPLRLLEVGCGAGNNLGFAASRGFDCYGLDISIASLIFAQQKMTQSGHSVNFAVADAARLPYAGSSFSVVIDRGALSCLTEENVENAIAEVARVLEKDGLFLFNSLTDNHHTAKKQMESFINYKFSESALRRHLGSAGLALESIRCIESRNLLELNDVHSEWLVVARKHATE